ncbi:MAG: 5'/3'-nucleotidase SurE [Candidatus Bathyarchaeota archaeon]|nr:5'/3'-nucleotidase SurE [Candidatus Bathyarchaeum tardum]WGM88891.1 MAG: 5'/3'-nucleotidase SurE [Candidatus Bathyarchaeum tardum]
MPTILVTNDDGVDSIGLSVLAKQLTKLGDVVVVTPGCQRSGVGKSISIGQVKICDADLGDGITAYATTGTPADSFLIAINKILKKMPDLLVSGINIGPNLGIDDLLTSGTVGAAFEAAIHNIPAIAVSYCLSELSDKTFGNTNFSVKDLELAAHLGYKASKHVLESGMPADVDIISINVPENADPKNVLLTSLCYDGYGDIHDEITDGYEIKSWALHHYPDGAPGTDLHAIKNGNYVSVTPIKVEFPHNTKAMKGLLDSLSD